MDKQEATIHIKETCGSGWLPLVDRVYDLKPEGVAITSIYQKWGALMFDAEPWGDAIEKLHDEIEEVSLKTCEICGTAGSEHNVDNWIHTRCEEHGKHEST